MAAPTSLPLGDLAGDFYSRRLLLLSLNSHRLSSLSTTASPPTPVVTNVSTSSNPDAYRPGDNSFDSNVVMVLSVLLCALICSLGLNSIIRCALRCSSFVASDPSSGSTPTRLANTGVKRKALKTCPIVSYSSEQNLPRLDTECVICLSEFSAGERVRLLPKCHHGFHVKCIDRWLSSHSSCPTCRHCLIETCQKIVGCSSTNTSTSQSQPQQIHITIASLEPEDFVRNYRGANQL